MTTKVGFADTHEGHEEEESVHNVAVMGPMVIEKIRARVVGVAAAIGVVLVVGACGGSPRETESAMPSEAASGTASDAIDEAAPADVDTSAAEASDVAAASQTPPGEPCPDAPVENYLETQWQLCWFEEPAGRWRRLDHTLHYTVLVVQAEATSLDLAETIARRFVAQHAERFPDEIMVYVHAAPADRPTRVRRVTWTPGGGYRVLDFDA